MAITKVLLMLSLHLVVIGTTANISTDVERRAVSLQ